MVFVILFHYHQQSIEESGDYFAALSQSHFFRLLSVAAANGLKISSDRSDIFRVEPHIVMTADSAD